LTPPAGDALRRQRRRAAPPRTRACAPAALALALVCAGPAAAQDGRAVFEARCASCHALSEAAPPGPGPQLAKLAGRRLGGDPRFDYSPSLRGAEGAWTADLLARFLDDPEEMFPGLWMGANGLRDGAERRAVVDFLIGR
jgi:cytochrome c